MYSGGSLAGSRGFDDWSTVKKLALSLAVSVVPVLWAAAGAQASVVCTPGDAGTAACAQNDSGASVTASSSTAPVGGSASAGTNSTVTGVYAYADGADANPGPTAGFVSATADSTGASVTCGATGAPGSTTSCP